MADSDNSALEDARKRARRRLVGVVVLALAAAVVLPMFLESDPRPLGPEVQIQIPAIDDAKFQNRLTPGGAVPAPVPVPDKAPPPIVPDAPKEIAPSPASAAPLVNSEPAGKAETPAAAPSAAAQASESKSTDSKPVAARPAEPKSVADQKAAVAPAIPGAFVVQLGAFVDAAVAQQLAAKAGGQGFSAFLESVTTKSGQVQRVRVGPFATRAEADAAAGKLKAAGFTAVARPR